MDKEYLIRKWLTGELTEEENQAFKALQDYDSHLKVLHGAQHFKASVVSETADLDSFYLKLRDKRSKVKSMSRFVPFLKIAASIVIVLGIVSLFFRSPDTTVTTMIGQKASISLPDASEVFLNSKSSITYNKKKWSKQRTINLYGEALFKVSKGSKFDVVTSMGTVTVLGTQFNVKTRQNYFEVTCFEGLVSTTYNGERTKALPAGSSLRISNGIISVENDIVPFSLWSDNVSNFKSVPFGEVIKEFERQYKVTFSTENVDMHRIFTGGFVHNNLQDGLKSITLPLDLNYTIETSNRITLQNTKE